MKARDVMTSDVVTVGPDAGVREVAQILIGRGISAVPVIDAVGRVVGIVSEGDFIRRAETETERPAAWWRVMLTLEERAREFAKSHGMRARDVMTSPVITVAEDTSLETVATLFERHRIKRVPVLSDGRLVGLVSRTDLLKVFLRTPLEPAVRGDAEIAADVHAAMEEAGVRTELLDILVTDGTVHLSGSVATAGERQAARIASESVVGVGHVESRISVLPRQVKARLWA